MNPPRPRKIPVGTFAPIVVNHEERSLHTPDGGDDGVWHASRGARLVRLGVAYSFEQYTLIAHGSCVFCEDCHPKGRYVNEPEALLFVERGVLPVSPSRRSS